MSPFSTNSIEHLNMGMLKGPIIISFILCLSVPLCIFWSYYVIIGPLFKKS